MKRDLVSLADLSPHECLDLLDKAAVLKRGLPRRDLEGKTIALLFQKPSLRTKMSFDVAMTKLGGHAVYLSPDEVMMGKREATEDVARVLSRFVEGIVARTFSHREVQTLAKYATVPVVNALSDGEHPCQALADLMTIRERKGPLPGVTVSFIGDGNNVATSLALGVAMMGGSFRIASPRGYELPGDVQEHVLDFCKETRGTFEQMEDPIRAVRGADVIYTDVWTSMGQEAETAARKAAFQGYQVSKQLFGLAKHDAIFMHPLPAHRSEEVAPEVLEHPNSVVFDQAENRLHAQKAVLLEFLADGAPA